MLHTRAFDAPNETRKLGLADAAGGRYLVRGASPEMLEGSSEATRIAIVEFDTAERARDFYHSASYQTAREKRLSAADFRMTLIEGA